MDRLRDQRESSDPIVARAAKLVSARTPLAEDPERRRRVRARLRRPRTAPRYAGWLRLAVGMGLLCSVAAASAMIGRVAESIRARIVAHREAVAGATRHHHRHAGSAKAPPPSAALPALPALPAPQLPATELAAPPPAVAAPSPAVAPQTVAAAPPPRRAAVDEQRRLLAAGVRALRYEHDPARAAALLGRYLDRYPEAMDAEDVYALAIEATLGRDRPRAAGLAVRYLARYPGGRWTALAHRALDP